MSQINLYSAKILQITRVQSALTSDDQWKAILNTCCLSPADRTLLGREL